MDQQLLIYKVDRLRKALNKTGDDLVLHNPNGIPNEFKKSFFELSELVETIDSTVCRTLEPEYIDWCNDVVNQTSNRFNEFNFIVVMYNQKIFKEKE